MMKLKKNSLQTRLTDEHLESLQKISSLKTEADFEPFQDQQSQFHVCHTLSSSKSEARHNTSATDNCFVNWMVLCTK
jgi:hypothetical protein